MTSTKAHTGKLVDSYTHFQQETPPRQMLTSNSFVSFWCDNACVWQNRDCYGHAHFVSSQQNIMQFDAHIRTQKSQYDYEQSHRGTSGACGHSTVQHAHSIVAHSNEMHSFSSCNDNTKSSMHILSSSNVCWKSGSFRNANQTHFNKQPETGCLICI